MKKFSILLITLFFISACSGESKTVIKSQPETPKEEPRNPTKKAGFADGQIQVYKNSQDVESTLGDTEKKRREEMEKQGI